MTCARWPAVALVLLSSVAPAAQGVHPGPLPAPIDAPSSGMPPASPEGGWTAPSTPGYGGDRGSSDRQYEPYLRPPAGGYQRPRGYWKWVPVEPGSPEADRYDSGMPPGGSGAYASYPGLDAGYPDDGYPPGAGYYEVPSTYGRPGAYGGDQGAWPAPRSRSSPMQDAPYDARFPPRFDTGWQPYAPSPAAGGRVDWGAYEGGNAPVNVLPPPETTAVPRRPEPPAAWDKGGGPPTRAADGEPVWAPTPPVGRP